MGGQFQAPCDLLDGMSLDEETQYVELARGEPVPRGQGRYQLIGGSRLQDDGHAPATERAGRQAEPAPGPGADPGKLVASRALLVAGGGHCLDLNVIARATRS